VQTMRESMLKRCPVSSYEQVRGVFAKDLGESPETVSALSASLHYYFF
jgi:aarF domain-containing kinase